MLAFDGTPALSRIKIPVLVVQGGSLIQFGCHGLTVFGMAVQTTQRHGHGEDPKTVARSYRSLINELPCLVVGRPLKDIDPRRAIVREIKDIELIVMDPAKHFGLIEYHQDFGEQTAQFCLK